MQVTNDDLSRPAVDSVELTLSQVGDSWTFLILREAYFGVRRFDAFQKNLGAAPNIVTGRLKKLVANGLLVRQPYSERPPRFEYRLTEKGADLYPAIMLLKQWGDRWLNQSEERLDLVHTPCGNVTTPDLRCEHCQRPIHATDMRWECRPLSPAAAPPSAE